MGVGLGYCCCAGGVGTCYTICEWFNRLFFDATANAIGVFVGADAPANRAVIDPTGFTTLYGEKGALLDLGIGIQTCSAQFLNNDGSVGVPLASPDGYDGCLLLGNTPGAPGARVYYNYAAWSGSLSNFALASGQTKTVQFSLYLLPWRAAFGGGAKDTDPCIFVTMSAFIEDEPARTVAFYVMDKFCREDADIPGYIDGPTYVYAKNVWTGISQGSFLVSGSDIDTALVQTRTLRPGLQINFGPTHALWPNTAVRIGFGTIAS